MGYSIRHLLILVALIAGTLPATTVAVPAQPPQAESLASTPAAATSPASGVQRSYVPLRKGFLPAFTGEVQHTPASTGPAPNAPSLTGKAAAEAIQALAGSRAYAVDVYPDYNLVRFTADNPTIWTIIAPLPGNSYFGGDFVHGDSSTLYVVDYYDNTLSTVNTATGAVTLIGSSIPGAGESWTGLTAAVDGTMYGSATTIAKSTLYRVNLETGALTTVGQITNGPAIIDIAIAPSGEMYGVDIVNDVLVEINPATGAGTVVGSIGFNANYAQGMDFDDATGTLYLAAFNAGSFGGELRICDPATGNSALVGAFPGGAQVDSLAFATVASSLILHIATTPTTESVQLALQQLGYAYVYLYSADWTGIDFAPYDTVLVGMDGGAVNEASIHKVRTDVIDAGKRLIFLGGTCYQPFAIGVNDRLVGNLVGNYCWKISGLPQWTITHSGHPLARGLPSSYNYTETKAGYYQLRATDVGIEPVAVNGDGYTAFFHKTAFAGLEVPGDFTWYIDSPYSGYWANPSDFAFLKQLIANVLRRRMYLPLGVRNY